jgi:hypothetical protein
MKLVYTILCVVFLSLLYSCSSDDSSTDSQVKEYDVEYQITSSGTISETDYLTFSGDTLQAQNVASGWSYKWTTKGKSGGNTYLKVTIKNSATTAYLKILANNVVIKSDSVEGVLNGISSVAIGTSLPY